MNWINPNEQLPKLYPQAALRLLESLPVLCKVKGGYEILEYNKKGGLCFWHSTLTDRTHNADYVQKWSEIDE